MLGAEPTKVLALGAIEQWDAHRAIGNVFGKAHDESCHGVGGPTHGIGLVALRNANHWMRGGGYGYQAAEKGYIGICWSNSIAVMPPWGAKECRIGTNPFIVAVPTEPVTMIDMSMSMFSYGMLEVNRLAGRQLPVDGGFDDDGNLTRDPATIEKNRRILPMGYWKGSGMSIVLDMIATLLSNGESVASVTEDMDDEYGVSQIFIAIEVDRLIPGDTRSKNWRASAIMCSRPSAPIGPFVFRAMSSSQSRATTRQTASRWTIRSGHGSRRCNRSSRTLTRLSP